MPTVVSPVYPVSPETSTNMWKLRKKWFAIEKRAFFCREDSTIEFLLVKTANSNTTNFCWLIITHNCSKILIGSVHQFLTSLTNPLGISNKICKYVLLKILYCILLCWSTYDYKIFSIYTAGQQNSATLQLFSFCRKLPKRLKSYLLIVSLNLNNSLWNKTIMGSVPWAKTF